MPTESISRSPAQNEGRARRAAVDDRLALGGDLLRLVWHHKLWWAVPVLVGLLLLAMLVVLQATPLGPLIYPLF
ncbi:MAG TPA: DUF5989 family protein [Chloroflexota bacterium]|nr:DUF5989 family protein [Chloroflexota bacterium]